MDKPHITLTSYVSGFILSVSLTFFAYWAATSPSFESKSALGIIIVLAFLQLVAQLVFFLHLGKESKPRLGLFIFGTAVIGISILVFGSLWIMNHLNYRMSPADMNSFIVKNEGISQ